MVASTQGVIVQEASINWDDEAECWVLCIMWMTPDGTSGDVAMVELPACEEG